MTQSASPAELMARIVASGTGSLPLVEAAGELVAEDARFTAWFLREVKPAWSDIETYRLVEVGSRWRVRCERAWARYPDAAAPEELVSTLRGYRDWLRDVRQTGVVFGGEDVDVSFLDD